MGMLVMFDKECYGEGEWNRVNIDMDMLVGDNGDEGNI